MDRMSHGPIISKKEYAAVLLRLREQAKRRMADAEAAGKRGDAEFWAHNSRKFEEIIAKHGYDRDAKGS